MQKDLELVLEKAWLSSFDQGDGLPEGTLLQQGDNWQVLINSIQFFLSWLLILLLSLLHVS